ncbi:MAG: DUF3352 domain-containing protein [Leptolyngbya sp.]|nr:DUF3352 domain-containing protein [Leptolyngbya sp.]
MFVKKPPLLLTLGTALVLMGGGAIAYWATQQRLGTARGMPTGARAIPDNALLVVSVATDGGQWQQLRQLGTPDTQASFDQRLARWRDRWLTQYDLDFATHIQPWVGPEVTLAWLPQPLTEGDADLPALIPGEENRLLLLPIADAEAAADLASTLPIPSNPEAAVEYRGVTLTPYDPDGAGGVEPLWTGVLGTALVLIADDQMAAEQAIDAYRGGRSLVDLPGFAQAVDGAAIAQPFSKLYINVPAAIQYLAQSSQPPIPPAIITSLQASRGLVASIGVSSQGLQIQSSSWLLPDSDRLYTAQTPIPAALPQYLPQDTLMLASGSNFQQFWEDFSAGRTLGALTALDPDALALSLQAGTGLTLEEDLLPWLGGEFALALLPQTAAAPTDPSATLPNPGLVLLAQASDRPLAERTFAQLDEVVQSRYRFQLKQTQRQDIALTQWVSPFQSTTLAHGWLTASVAFLTVGPDIDAAIAPPPDRPLTTAPLFQLVMGNAPKQHNGHFYLNLEALAQGGDNLFLPQIPPEGQGFVQALRGIGVTATILDERRLRYDLFIAMQRGDRPGPLPAVPEASTPGEE